MIIKIIITTKKKIPLRFEKIRNLISATDEKGEAFFSKIPGYGKYYLLEKRAPDGYELDLEKHYFEITDNKTKEIVLYDSKIEVKIDDEIPLNPETYDISNYFKYAFYSLLLLLLILTFIYIFNKIREE